MAQVNFHEGWDDDDSERLEASATNLKQSILTLDKKRIKIQEVYSRKKSEFMRMLPDLNLGTLKNPFLSTGDTPFHALKYAYGIKPYQENSDDPLRPRWREDGTAERPYSGKAYLFLIPIGDYIDAPLHVPSLYFHGKINLSSLILSERETTFPAHRRPC